MRGCGQAACGFAGRNRGVRGRSRSAVRNPRPATAPKRVAARARRPRLSSHASARGPRSPAATVPCSSAAPRSFPSCCPQFAPVTPGLARNCPHGLAPTRVVACVCRHRVPLAHAVAGFAEDVGVGFRVRKGFAEIWLRLRVFRILGAAYSLRADGGRRVTWGNAGR